jgi:hypothetical protein
MVSYERSRNMLWLASDDASAWLAPVAAGSAAKLQNSQCEIDAARSSASGLGNTLVVNVALTFTSAFTGEKKAFALAADAGGLGSGWSMVGTWKPQAVVNQAPSVVSLAPASGSGATAVLSVTASDGNGFLDLTAVNVVVNSDLSSVRGCMISYERARNMLWLASDDASAWLAPIAAGSSAKLQNSQCEIDAARSSASGSGTHLTLNVAVTFKTGFIGDKKVFALAGDAGGLNSGWWWVGTWAVR